MDIQKLIVTASARGSASGFSDAIDEVLPTDFDRTKARIFTPLKVGDLLIQHRVVHPGLGRSRSAYGAESPLAAKYFAQRTLPGSLMISQATGVSAESVPWQWAGSLHNDCQQSALAYVIAAVHNAGGFWFQQLFHVGRCTTPALVRLARQRADLDKPEYGYRPVSSWQVAESGLNTHSGEGTGIPYTLSITDIRGICNDYKNAAKRAVAAGADGIEILAGNGWLIDQFLHDNINHRTDIYGGSVENRSRFALEVVEAVADIVGYQRIGIRISPFSYFHETDGSQPLDQLLHLCRELIIRGVAYIHAGQGKFTRNLSVEDNTKRLVGKGISVEDISLRPFRRLLDVTEPQNRAHTRTKLIGNGGYSGESAIVAVESGLADGVSFGRRFISNPDLVDRIRLNLPLAANDVATFYTHGANGYTSYTPFGTENNSSGTGSPESKASSDNPWSGGADDRPSEKSTIPAVTRRSRVAIVGAGVVGILSAAALARLGNFETVMFERRKVAGGIWARDSTFFNTTKSPGVDETIKLPSHIIAGGSFLELTTSELGDHGLTTLSADQISAAVAQRIHQFEHQISYDTHVERVDKLPSGGARLSVRSDTGEGQSYLTLDFDHVIIATGHEFTPEENTSFSNSVLPSKSPLWAHGKPLPPLYEHIFDIGASDTIAFNGVVTGALPWIVWEKSAFVIGLLWSNRIRLPASSEVECWISRQAKDNGSQSIHDMSDLPRQVVYFDELNELAAQYLHSGNLDDSLLRSFPFRWVLEILRARAIGIAPV